MIDYYDSKDDDVTYMKINKDLDYNVVVAAVVVAAAAAMDIDVDEEVSTIAL